MKVTASRSPIVAEYITRREREVAKAVAKYGAAALAPGGVPAYDILDYAINELVGLVRYAQMIEHRMTVARISALSKTARETLDDGIAVARQMEAVGGRLAFDTIAVRQKALALGLIDGSTEER